MLRSNAKQIEKRKHLGGEEGIRALYRGPVVSGSPFLLRVTFKIPIVYEEHAENVWIRRLSNRAEI